MYSKLSNLITDKIFSTIPNVPDEKREIIEYGAYMALSEISKTFLLLIVAWALHVLIYITGIILIFGLLRWNLGGIHAKSHWACMISYAIFIYGILTASLLMKEPRIILDLIVIPLSYIVTCLYAPADLPVKPVVSQKQRKRLRITGLILLSALFITAQFLSIEWFNILMLTISLVIVLMTPPIYRLTRNQYGKEVPV